MGMWYLIRELIGHSLVYLGLNTLHEESVDELLNVAAETQLDTLQKRLPTIIHEDTPDGRVMRQWLGLEWRTDPYGDGRRYLATPPEHDPGAHR